MRNRPQRERDENTPPQLKEFFVHGEDRYWKVVYLDATAKEKWLQSTPPAALKQFDGLPDDVREGLFRRELTVAARSKEEAAEKFHMTMADAQKRLPIEARHKFSIVSIEPVVA